MKTQKLTYNAYVASPNALKRMNEMKYCIFLLPRSLNEPHALSSGPAFLRIGSGIVSSQLYLRGDNDCSTEFSNELTDPGLEELSFTLSYFSYLFTDDYLIGVNG